MGVTELLLGQPTINSSGETMAVRQNKVTLYKKTTLTYKAECYIAGRCELTAQLGIQTES